MGAKNLTQTSAPWGSAPVVPPFEVQDRNDRREPAPHLGKLQRFRGLQLEFRLGSHGRFDGDSPVGFGISPQSPKTHLFKGSREEPEVFGRFQVLSFPSILKIDRKRLGKTNNVAAVISTAFRSFDGCQHSVCLYAC